MFHSYDFSNNAMQLLSPWIFYSFVVFVLIFHLFLIQKDCENMLLCGFVCMSVLVLYCVSCLYVCGGVILAFIFLQPIENNSFRDASCLKSIPTHSLLSHSGETLSPLWSHNACPESFTDRQQHFSAFPNKMFIICPPNSTISIVESSTGGFA